MPEKPDKVDSIDAYVPPPYTVVGRAERAAGSGLSALLLNRGPRYPRKHIFTELLKAGFDYIVSMENPAEHYEIDELSAAFPSVRFILLSEPASVGERINIGARELRSPLFFVIWSDLRPLYGVSAARIAELLLLPANERGRGNDRNWYRRLCTAPLFQNARFEPFDSVIAPVLKRFRYDIKFREAEKENAPTLYPFDAVGVYDRARFFALGGFDARISAPEWQFADFGFRAWLSSEEICCTRQIRLEYEEAPMPRPADGAAKDDRAGFRRFLLKNIMPVLRAAPGGELRTYLPLKRLPDYLGVPGVRDGGLRRAAGNFFEVRRQIRAECRSFKTSAEALIRNWSYT